MGALPGDGGPCPICGEDMRSKAYPNETMFPELKELRPTISGRYWHMHHEHGILEDYDIRAALDET